MKSPLIELLRKNARHFTRVVPFDWQAEPVLALDLTAANTDLQRFDLRDTQTFEKYVLEQMSGMGARVAVGGYNEDRAIYRRSPHFGQAEQSELRSIHLGIDIWAVAGTPIFAPLDGKIHSLQNNAHFGDYGPTIILEHTLAGISFYTLYGHLNEEPLDRWQVGQSITQGQILAEIGHYPVNGDWPPHLHFQIIADMGDYWGDFPGVCSLSQREHFLERCPDANLILQIPQLL